MNKKLLFLFPLLIPVLTGCKNDINFKIEDFYSDLEARNYTVSDGEITQKFYHENAIMFINKGQVNTGVVKLNQGIFEIYENSDGYHTHGMITSNTTLDILDGCNNFHDLSYISLSNWEKLSSDTYRLKLTKNVSNILPYTGYFLADDWSSIDRITLTKTDNHAYSLSFKYIKERSKDNYSVKLTNYKKNKNKKLDDFISSTVVSKQTEWNEYQLSALNRYGLSDVPFLSSYSLGMKLNFAALPGSLEGICFVYDCLPLSVDMSNIGSELISLGFEKDSESRYHLNTPITGLALNLEYHYVTYSEIEEMVRQGYASEGDLLAYPDGYIQYVFSHGSVEVTSSISEINSKYMSTLGLSDFKEESYISKVGYTDYKDMFNEQAMTDPEYLEMFELIGEEPGPIYESYASIYLYIESIDDAVSYIDSYRTSLESNGYIFSSPYDEDSKDKSIIDLVTKSAAYYHPYSDSSDIPLSNIYFYLYDSSSSEHGYDGVIEIVVEKYTELGIKLFYGE